MQHYHHLNAVDLPPGSPPAIVTIGVFDGVHRGHQYLVRQVVEEARRTEHLAVVLTLFPHPDRVIRNQTGRYYLTTPEQKAVLLGELGVDIVVTHPFDTETRTMRARTFVDLLREKLNMSSLRITRDFALGYQREGNLGFLSTLGAQLGYTVQEITLVMDDGQHVISSTTIREALSSGDVERAALLLGRPYFLAGTVIHGDQRGRTIGFPTANLEIWGESIVPANGVYACFATLLPESTVEPSAELEGLRYMAVTNIGYRPTFAGQNIRIEAHLLNFDADIYGRILRLEFIARLRGERKFDGLPALREQIRLDSAQAQDLLTPRQT